METLGHSAPDSTGVLIPLLLYAEDLIIKSTTPVGLQWRPDTLLQNVLLTISKGWSLSEESYQEGKHMCN